MQYTIRNIPTQLDQALRQRARHQGKSLNEVAKEILQIGLGLGDQPVKRRDFSDIAGTWIAEPEIDEALNDQRSIDPELWR